MKRLVLAATFALLATRLALSQTAPAPMPPAPPAAAPGAPPASFKTEEQKTLYTLGIWLSQQVRQQVGVFDLTKADYKFVLMGLRDSLLGEKLKLDPAAYGTQLNALAQSRMKIKADKEKKKAKGFWAKSAKEPGAQTFPSGLIYFEIQAGTGTSPAAADSVKAHYKGTLIDGTVFDESAKHGAQPMEFALDHVIPCWTEGIQKMKAGGKAKLVCPSDIAYGDRGNSAIPGGAALIFEVELVDVVKTEKPKAPDYAEFLANAAKEPGAQVSPSGLIYKEIKAGAGASPKPTDTIKAHYHGTLTDGSVFDSSVQRGQPLEFSLQGVIRCWQEGIPKMKVGGKAKFVCPADIAYGSQGSGKIPPNAPIIFEVELLDIVK